MDYMSGDMLALLVSFASALSSAPTGVAQPGRKSFP